MIKMLGKNYYTVTQAAALAGCTVSYVRRLLREKAIVGEKFNERAWAIPANQLEKLKHSPTGKAGKPRIGKKSQ
jgi:excisionase family DNA binding protein